MEPFIAAQQDIADAQSLEWKHYSALSKKELQQRWLTPAGKGLFNALRSANFSRNAIENHVGKFSGKFDLRGIALSEVNLDRHDLTNIDFFGADLSRTSFIGANLSHSYLSECNLRGSCVNWANLDGAFLDNVQFDKNTSFLGVDLHKVNFTLATLLYDLALTQQRIQQLEQPDKAHPIGRQ